jgi:hypothetical protein
LNNEIGCRCVVGHATVAKARNVKGPSKGESVVNERNPDSGSAFQAIRAIDYSVSFARDMAAMRRFYEDIPGFPLRRELSPNWIEYRVGDNTLALARPRLTAADVPTPNGGASLQLAFKVSALGAQFVTPLRVLAGRKVRHCWIWRTPDQDRWAPLRRLEISFNQGAEWKPLISKYIGTIPPNGDACAAEQSGSAALPPTAPVTSAMMAKVGAAARHSQSAAPSAAAVWPS